MSAITDRVTRAAGVEGLVKILAERISPTDLQSLLLELFRLRASSLQPAAVLRRYEGNPSVLPSGLDPKVAVKFDQLAFEAAAQFDAIEHSPVAPLGTISALTGLDQNVVVTTVRNTEVVSDSTNVMALECARRLRTGRRRGEAHGVVRLCSSHRVLRPQPLTNPAFRPHFRLFGLCTAGATPRAWRDEADWLIEHIAVHLELLTKLPSIGLNPRGVMVAVTPLDDRVTEGLLEEFVFAPLKSGFPQVQFIADGTRKQGRNYYWLACFAIKVTTPEGQEHSIVDGGFVRWMQLLLSDQKQRLLISGIGSELTCTLLSHAR